LPVGPSALGASTGLEAAKDFDDLFVILRTAGLADFFTETAFALAAFLSAINFSFYAWA
jgi:hypothetical protein